MIRITTEQCFYPFLVFLADKQSSHMKEIGKFIKNSLNLSDEEKSQISGQIIMIESRIGWARTCLYKSGLIDRVSRAVYKITDLAIAELERCKNNPKEMESKKYLHRFPKFVDWLDTFGRKIEDGKDNVAEEVEYIEVINNPEESIETGYRQIFSSLQQDLLENIKKCDPSFFEKLVVDLILAMGYGGSKSEVYGEVVGKSGDGGIDGIIKEDRLGLDFIYLQAKRWQGVVGSGAIRDFVGALDAKKANKGIFITTSFFSKDAIESIKHFTKKVVLVDGEMLSRLMIENNIGVSKVISYEIKKIDSDYFEFE